MDTTKPTTSLRSRLLWFAGLYLAGLLVTAGGVYLLRALMHM